MTYHFDRLSVYRGTIVVEGWSTIGPPVVFYNDGAAMTSQTSRCFDLEDGRERFLVRAVTGDVSVNHDAIVVVFRDGTVVNDAGTKALTAVDLPYQEMFAEFYRETTRGGRLLEIGSRARSGNVHRHLFASDVEYTGMDIKDGPNVDVVGDAHELVACVGKGFDFIFSNAVFEHLLMPWKVAIEMGHVLKPGGVALVASHAAFPLHEEPWDFWRYSKNAWQGIFNKHTGFQLIDAQYSVRCAIVSDYACPPIKDIDLSANYVLSACLVKKIAEPLVRWDGVASEVYDLFYDY